MITRKKTEYLISILNNIDIIGDRGEVADVYTPDHDIVLTQDQFNALFQYNEVTIPEYSLSYRYECTIKLDNVDQITRIITSTDYVTNTVMH